MNEVHVNMNDTDANPLGFNQNRLFTGIRRQLGAGFIEGGYLLQLVNEYGPAPNQVNHVIYTRLLMPLWQVESKKINAYLPG